LKRFLKITPKGVLRSRQHAGGNDRQCSQPTRRRAVHTGFERRIDLLVHHQMRFALGAGIADGQFRQPKMDDLASLECQHRAGSPRQTYAHTRANACIIANRKTAFHRSTSNPEKSEIGAIRFKF
jgi:hypothetical protein